ncbi:MAG: ribosome silencing factor [Clostridiales bacterium]|jgi:ribosome-associated protein|nr:ribosome silencing factor [Clostridiales bacterium]
MTKEETLEKELFQAAKAVYQTIDDKFGKDITVLDIKNISVMADYFVIATAGNSSQLKAMGDAVDQKLFSMGIRLRHAEGTPASGWILLDFGSMIVHLFDTAQRAFYNLEHIWGDAETVRTELLK